MISIALKDEAASIALGGALANALGDRRAGWMLLLKGDLGAGKSTVARALLRALGHEGSVPSPTYTLVEPYDLSSGYVYHIDLYRIASLEELEHLGWSDLSDGLILLEWPEKAPEVMEQADVLVELTYEGSGRRATVSALSARAQEIVSSLDQSTTYRHR
jgi:tRNA threonylcarbamoyladenosine biosynthesis protein TsaE